VAGQSQLFRNKAASPESALPLAWPIKEVAESHYSAQIGGGSAMANSRLSTPQARAEQKPTPDYWNNQPTVHYLI